MIVVKTNATTVASSLIVNPAMTLEPTNGWTDNTTGGTSVPSASKGLGGFYIRQGTDSIAPTLKLDGLRVGLSWSDVMNNVGIYKSSPTLSGFSYNFGNGPSSEQILSVSGNQLTSNIVITPPTNYQISKTSGAGFTSSPITLTQSAGSIASTNIYVRLKSGLLGGDYQENIVLSSTGVTSQNVSCSGTVVGPTITPSSSSISALNYDKGNGPSSEQTFTVTGNLLDADVVITPSSTNLQISKTSGSGFASTPITLTQSGGNVATTTIYVRLKAGLNFADYTENLAITSTNAIPKNVACTGTVAGPTIKTISTTLTGFSYARGAGPSTSKNFSLTGVLLEANLIVTPSTNYEISTNNSIFVSTPISLIPSAGTVLNNTIYVRLKAGLTAGAYNENWLSA